MLRRTRLGNLSAFCIQYDALKFSAHFYDLGYIHEAVRIANAIFILLGPKSKNHTPIVDRIWPGQLVLSSRGRLAAIECVPIQARGCWIVSAIPGGRILLAGADRIDIPTWWSIEVLTSHGGPLTRLDLVKAVRDRDGGAHVDETITDPEFKSVLLHGGGFKYRPSAEAPEQPVENMIEAVLRQMALEVLDSLRPHRMEAGAELNDAAQTGQLQYFIEEQI